MQISQRNTVISFTVPTIHSLGFKMVFNFKGTRFITKKQFCRAFNENDCQIGSLIPSQFISIRVLNNPEI